MAIEWRGTGSLREIEECINFSPHLIHFNPSYNTILEIDISNNVSRHQKCGLNICCCARKLTMDRGNGGVFIPQLGSQAHVLAAASHGLGCGGWSCRECQSGPCVAYVFQYRDSILSQNCHLSSNDSQARRKRIFKGPRRLGPGFSGNNLWKSSKSEVYPLRSAAGCYIRVWCVYWMRYSSLPFRLESKMRSNFHSSISSPSSSLMKTSPVFRGLLVCSWPESPVAITSQRRELWKVL